MHFSRNNGVFSWRAALIYLVIAVAGVFLASTVVTTALLAIYAPEDAEPLFFLKQSIFAALSLGLIVWLWRKRRGDKDKAAR